ncbi:MAG: M14 metallopeptidase family protein [Bacteroidota bacterium]
MQIVVRMFVVAFLWSCLNLLYAQNLPAAFEIEIPGISGYNSEIKTPDEVLRHTIGTRHTVPHELVDYFEAVAEASDRVSLHTHGYSYENRPLIHAIVTSPANHARLEAIRAQNLRLSDDPDSISEADLDEMPVVVYQGYSIHGNEASGSEAAVLYLYHLAAAQGVAFEEMLENVVIILDPLFNPDGRDRFTDWVNRNRGRVHTTDPNDREHNEPWPGGRTNHYWFDLNRDWLPAQHPESQGRLDIFHNWRPQVLTDHHEMGGTSSFFFMPGIPSRNNPGTPEENFVLTAGIADFHAKWLDRTGSLYYSKESFDDFYYGKGSTYPDANGAIGILFEQASSRALESETDHGNLTYAFTVKNQFSTSLSTLEAVTALRKELLTYQQTFYASAAGVARSNRVKAYVVDLTYDRTRAQKFGEMLSRHRVQMYMLDRDFENEGRVYAAGEAFVVPVAQPQARVVKAMFDRTTAYQDSLFYDVSTWTMPLAFDLDYSEIRSNPADYLGAAWTATPDGGRLVGGVSEIGYLLKWNRYFAGRTLYNLLEAGFFPRLLHHAADIRVNGRVMSFEPGTIFVPAVHRDPARRHLDAGLLPMLEKAVAEDHVEVFAAESGFALDGPDLGTRSATILKTPVVGLITGSGASGYNAGEVWHLLSERFHIPVSLLDSDELADIDLDRYTTLVLAGGFYSGLNTEVLSTWMRRGGNLVTLHSGTDWAVRNNLIDLERKPFDTDSLYKDLPFNQLDEARGAQRIGGLIAEGRLDTTHPLSYGLRDTIPLFRRGTSFYEPATTPGVNVGVYTTTPLLSGYVSEPQLKNMAGSAALVAMNKGRGSIIAFADNPNFRAFWYGTNRLFVNAVFFGNAF